jgi:hypothetical protein
MQSRLISNKVSDRFQILYVNTLFIILFINFIKPLCDYYFGIPNSVFTITQFFFLFVLYVAHKMTDIKFSLYEYILLTYLSIRYVIEIFVFKTGFFQPTVSLVKFFILILGMNFFMNNKFSNYFYLKVEKLLWGYFILTIAVSIIQQQDTFLGSVFSTYGGNIMSGNAFGIVRSSGGIGGTVIDYSVFIMFIIILYFFSFKIEGRSAIHFLLILCASWLTVSRVTLLVFVILILAYVIKRIMNISDIKSFLLVVVFSVVVILIINNNLIKFAFWGDEPQRVSSDEVRIGQWFDVSDELDHSSYIIGYSMGKNTGLPEQYKTVGDGHLQGFLSDYGILGLLLYLLFLLKSTYKSIPGLHNAITVFIVIMVVFLINSGADKFFNIFIFPIIFGLIKQSFQQRYVQFKAKKNCVSKMNHFERGRVTSSGNFEWRLKRMAGY